MGHVSGVVAPSGLGEGGLLGLALDPDDQDVLYAYITTGSDNRVVRMSIAGGKVGNPKAILTGIPTSTHHHGGKLLFAPDKTLFVSAGDAEDSSHAQSKTLAGRQDPADPARRKGRLVQPVRQPDLDLRSPQHRRARLRRARPALGHRIRRQAGR